MDRFLPITGGLLVFNSSGQDWAFPLHAVQEIAPMAELSSPPGMPPVLAGFLNLGGVAVPIIRLDKLFELPEQRPGLHAHLIILRSGGEKFIGVLVGSVRRIANAAPTSFLPVPENNVFQDCAVASVTIDDRVTHVLSPERILLEQERRMLWELQAMAQHRLDDLGREAQ
ncbi:MAG TPA: chemotaxis protein CheW [Bryobacteraceae bacterium]